MKSILKIDEYIAEQKEKIRIRFPDYFQTEPFQNTLNHFVFKFPRENQEDATQEILIVMYSAMRAYPYPGPFPPDGFEYDSEFQNFIYRRLLWRTKNIWRSLYRKGKLKFVEIKHNIRYPYDDTEKVHIKIQLDIFEDILKRDKTKSGEASLKVFQLLRDGYSASTISNLMGISYPYVMKLAHNNREKLKKLV